MGTRPDTPVRALRRRHDALLTIWLAFLHELDSPVRRRAAEIPQKQRPRRDIATPNKSRQLQSVWRTLVSGPDSWIGATKAAERQEVFHNPLIRLTCYGK